MDNFYYSSDLASKLIEKKTNCIDTLRLKRKYTPQDVIMSQLEKKGETVARYLKGITIGKRRDIRDVAYLSTEFKEQLKPGSISNYDRFLSGIIH